MNAPVRKFVAIGPESTGKSTLTQKLAEHFGTLWCAEYAREYLEKNGTDYHYSDLSQIAKGQLLQEDRLSKQSSSQGHPYLFIDTDMQVMRVWCEYVFNDCYPFILNQIAERSYDGYFLCAPDLPWVKDSMREYPDQKTRDELFLFYRELLTSQSIPWMVIRGGYTDRLEMAIDFVQHVSHA